MEDRANNGEEKAEKLGNCYILLLLKISEDQWILISLESVLKTNPERVLKHE